MVIASEVHRGSILWLTLLGLSLILICTPRFNRRDIGIQELTTSSGTSLEDVSDAPHYIALVHHFRGEKPGRELRAPFADRVLVPLIAAMLPLAPMTAINVINLCALIIALLLLNKILQYMHLSMPLRIVGCALFIFSFPTFYYSTVGYVDPVLLCFVVAGVNSLMKDKFARTVAITVVGLFAKETVVVLLPVLAARLFTQPVSWRRRALVLLAAAVLVSCAYYLIRLIGPSQGAQMSLPAPIHFESNISRLRMWLSLSFSAGLPAVLCVALIGRNLHRLRHAFLGVGFLWIGCASVLLLWCYSLFTAYADGRIIWTMSPFTIPLAMWGIHRWRSEVLFNNAHLSRSAKQRFLIS
jgi:hypothetical protein